MSAGPSHLVQILLPKETGKGELIGRDLFDGFLKEPTDEFGGVTSFLRARTRLPAKRRRDGEGQRRGRGSQTERLDPSYWLSLRERLERELSQDLIVIRTQEIRRL